MRKMLFGDLNTYLENPRYQREEQVATVLVGHGLTDKARHFLLRQKYRADWNWTWRMWRDGRSILIWGDNILGTTRQYFSMIGIREPITPTDHRMVLGVICGDGVTRH